MVTERLQKVQTQFATRAPVYEEKAAWIPDPGLLNCFVDMCRTVPDAEVLDVCCGTGLVGAGFRGKVKRVVGLDLTAEMLEQAKPRLDEVKQGLADHMPFEDHVFDVVVCRQALHFVDDPQQVLHEMHRVLKPGGQAIVGHRVPYGEEDAAWWEQVNRAKQPLLHNILLEQDLEAIFLEAGFEDLEKKNYYLVESIQLWTDSPEAKAAADEVFSIYKTAPPEAIKMREIQFLENEIRDRWRWLILSGIKR
ncbi:MAG: methyltransferase domain-containing protein [Armatimonadetes bacterium]|nr:methyltransferase domain-containing protein [Armatimonadota bacterium]